MTAETWQFVREIPYLAILVFVIIKQQVHIERLIDAVIRSASYVPRTIALPYPFPGGIPDDSSTNRKADEIPQ